MGKGKKRARIPKEDRQNLRLWAEGNREAILQPHIEPYGDAMETGWVAERKYFQRVSNEFHARVDWRLKNHEEPELGEFDPEAPLPAPEALAPDEQEKKEKRLALLDKRIRAWLKYRVKRLRRHVRTRGGSTKDPWAVLLAKLSGVKSPPKALQAYQQFMHECYKEKIEPTVAKEWAESAAAGSSVPTAKEPQANFRAEIARKLFAALPDDVKLGFATRAKEEAAEKRAKFEKSVKEQPSTSPQARQEAIDNLGTFMAPILQGIHERTGLHSVLILGGPIPKYGGDLRTIHISYGRNRSAVGAHFPQWAKERFNSVLGLMKEYLGTVFTTQECVDAALPTGLEGANFTIAPEESDDSSDSNASGSDSDSDSDVEKPLKKKARTSGKVAAPAKAKGKGSENAPPKKGAASVAASKAGTSAGKKAPKANLKRKEPDAPTPEPRRKAARLSSQTSIGVPGVLVPASQSTTGGAQIVASATQPIHVVAGAALPVSAAQTATPASQIIAGAAQPIHVVAGAAQAIAASQTATPASQIVAGAAQPIHVVAGAAQASHVVAGAALPVSATQTATPASQIVAGAAQAIAAFQTATPASQIVAGAAQPIHVVAGAAQAIAASQTATPASQIVAGAAQPIHVVAGAAQAIHVVAGAALPVSATQTATPASQIVAGAAQAIAAFQTATPASQIVAGAAQPIHVVAGAALPVSQTAAQIAAATAEARPSTGTPRPSAASIAALGGDAAAGLASNPAADSPSPFVLPDGAPKWLSEGVRQLSMVDLGCHFRSLVEALIRVEERFGFGGNPRSGVSNAGRPKEVDEWIKAGRGLRGKKGWDAGIRDVDDYGNRWWAWWDLLQPAWRTRGEHGGWALGEGYDDDWEWPSLAHPGQNGCLSVVASLYFWGSAKTAVGAGASWSARNRESWDWAVQDVVWMLEGMERKMLRDAGILAPRESWYM